MRKFLWALMVAVAFFESCIIDDDYGNPKPFQDLGELLTHEDASRFIWKPNTNEIIYIEGIGRNQSIKAVNISTKERRTIATYNNTTIEEIAWKNNSFQELIVSYNAGTPRNTLELLNISNSQKSLLANQMSYRSYNYWPDIFSNEKFAAFRKFMPGGNEIQATIINWATNQEYYLGDLYPIAVSPDYEQLILVDMNQWPRQYFIYAIETQDLFPLLGFGNFPASLIEWTQEGIIGYFIDQALYVRRNFSTFQDIRYDLPFQFNLLIKGSPSGKKFLFLYQQCRTNNNLNDCPGRVISEILVRDINQSEAIRVMAVEAKIFSEVSFSTEEDALAAIVDYRLYYKKIR